ncbi:MAG: phosphate transport system permease protein [Candidatus Tokpelaia sp. JSC161]|jgi:phosphate transport system permease protein|nr:MAG: phosphate transport system permease protein [Candidatus Tokpelaia sp. JSC161]
MSASGMILFVFALGGLGLFLSRARALAFESCGSRMHSRPFYYGLWTFFLVVFPSLLFFLLWHIGTNLYIEHQIFVRVSRMEMSGILHEDRVLVLRDVLKSLLQKSMVLSRNIDHDLLSFVFDFAKKVKILNVIGSLTTVFCACFGLVYGLWDTRSQKRARNKVECVIILSLIIASAIAVLVTIGILSSLFFQTVSFFRSVPLSHFFFGTVWDPRFPTTDSNVGQFGLVPLLAGTLYIACVAMLFAVPVGIFSAVYMAEYASPQLRSFIKPLLEILAGIPTIVYGFFALVSVGPFLRDLSSAFSGNGEAFIMAQSVLTAGIVMGIMLIPFISSLSDDIIRAVPYSLREGSFGLGATQSETIKRVVLSAAFPGIMAAVLLTASRAIGETMIVVMAAGVAAKLTINPFDAMTTITVKIVNQLTGDLEFNSPQTLVAFALGMTLFVVTLLMNIFALYIVRKYREQYE